MILHLADSICEAECPEEGHKFILELSPWEASLILEELPTNPAYESTQSLVGLLRRALERYPAPDEP